MSVSIFVFREIPGESLILRGPDVIDSLLATELVAIERGRIELDKNSGLQEINLQTLFRTGVRLGQTVRIIDAYQGREWRGKISGISHSSLAGTVITDLIVQKPAIGFTIDEGIEEVP